MKKGDRVRPIELEEDDAHLNPGTVTDDWSGKPSEMVRVQHDDGQIIWHSAHQLEPHACL